MVLGEVITAESTSSDRMYVVAISGERKCEKQGYYMSSALFTSIHVSATDALAASVQPKYT